MAPGYYNPYENSNTGAARLLAQQHDELLKADRARRLERMGYDLQDIRHRMDMIDRKIQTGTISASPHRYIEPIFVDAPEPSVEEYDAELPRWLERLISDPIWEIFKRPRIKV